MDKRRNVSTRPTATNSRIKAILALIVALLVSYFIITGLFHKQKVNYASRTLSLPKLDTSKIVEDDAEEDNGWSTITTQSGDSLSTIFKRIGLSSQVLQNVLHQNIHAKTLANIKPGQQIQLLIQQQQLEKLVFPVSATEQLVVSLEGSQYVSEIKSRKMTAHSDYLTATVRGSLYTTAKQQKIPYKLIQQMTDIFNWEIDFARDNRTGDQFSIMYEANYIDDKLVNTGDIIAVTYTNRGVPHQAIRHIANNGDYDYYTPKGASLKKAFTRYPVKFSHISSSYSLSRYHPVLHYRRAHKGVDLAAAIGTPVHATGAGRVEIIDRHNGYGNMVKISHNKTYATLYAHLLRFAKGLSRGDFVKRGQVIGYVGQTGLADGPHCHYEFHINHQPRNPTTVDLPRGTPIAGRELTSFKTKANTILAQLKLYEDANLVAAGKKSISTG
jgi:murein DD-endopeptidase MepM/ murein hydrolase activator NlpD